MSDASHVYGGDLQGSASGGLLLATGGTLAAQRVLRRLLTNPGEYIWHPDYGAGLGAYVGRPADPLAIGAVILQQIKNEETVARSPLPKASVLVLATGYVFVDLTFTAQGDAAEQALSFTVTGNGTAIIH